MACANNAVPLQLPWTNVTVSNDGFAVSRGIEVGIGTPNQIFSLRPSVDLNNTFLFNIANCGSASNSSCIGGNGGVYDPSKSSTYAVTIKDRWNGTDGYEIGQGNFIFFNDNIEFQQNGTVDGYPMFTDSGDITTQAGIPLGPGSSFIQAAVDAGIAPSPAWGLWTGSRSINDPIDGLLVVGGYDSSRVAEDWTNFTVSDWITVGCPLYVSITDMTYDYPGGSSSIFSNSSETLDICLDPFERGLEFPNDLFKNFQAASQAAYNSTYQLLTYPTANPPTGNLTITLDNGYQTVIDTRELYSQPRDYDSKGTYSILDNTIEIAEISNVSTADGYIPVFGIPYLTYNYLMVDYDSGTFSMAAAYRSDYFNIQPSPIPLCTPTSPLAPPVAPTPVAASPSASPSHVLVGAIAGGVIGGLAFLTIIGALIAFFLLQRRKQQQQRNNAARDPPAGSQDLAHKPSGYYSTYTATTDTTATELPSPDTHVKEWLNMQQQQPHEEQTPHEKMSSVITAPVEMPAHNYYR